MKILMGIVLILCAFFFYDPIMTLISQAGEDAGALGKILGYAVIGSPLFMGIGLILAAFKKKSCLFFIQIALFLAALVVIIMIALSGQNQGNKPASESAKPAAQSEAKEEKAAEDPAKEPASDEQPDAAV